MSKLPTGGRAAVESKWKKDKKQDGRKHCAAGPGREEKEMKIPQLAELIHYITEGESESVTAENVCKCRRSIYGTRLVMNFVNHLLRQ